MTRHLTDLRQRIVVVVLSSLDSSCVFVCNFLWNHAMNVPSEKKWRVVHRDLEAHALHFTEMKIVRQVKKKLLSKLVENASNVIKDEDFVCACVWCGNKTISTQSTNSKANEKAFLEIIHYTFIKDGNVAATNCWCSQFSKMFAQNFRLFMIVKIHRI